MSFATGRESCNPPHSQDKQQILRPPTLPPLQAPWPRAPRQFCPLSPQPCFLQRVTSETEPHGSPKPVFLMPKENFLSTGRGHTPAKGNPALNATPGRSEFSSQNVLKTRLFHTTRKRTFLDAARPAPATTLDLSVLCFSFSFLLAAVCAGLPARGSLPAVRVIAFRRRWPPALPRTAHCADARGLRAAPPRRDSGVLFTGRNAWTKLGTFDRRAGGRQIGSPGGCGNCLPAEWTCPAGHHGSNVRRDTGLSAPLWRTKPPPVVSPCLLGDHVATACDGWKVNPAQRGPDSAGTRSQMPVGRRGQRVNSPPDLEGRGLWGTAPLLCDYGNSLCVSGLQLLSLSRR